MLDSLSKFFSTLKRKIKKGDEYIVRDFGNTIIEEASEALFMDNTITELEKMGKGSSPKEDLLENTRETELEAVISQKTLPKIEWTLKRCLIILLKEVLDVAWLIVKRISFSFRSLTSPVSTVRNEAQLSEVVVDCSNDGTSAAILNMDTSSTKDFPPTDIDAIVKMFHYNDVDGLERKLGEDKEEGEHYRKRNQSENPEVQPEYWWDDKFARSRPTQSATQSILRDLRKIYYKYDTSTPYSTRSVGMYGRLNSSTPFSRFSFGTCASSISATHSLVHSLRKSLYKEHGLRHANPEYYKIAFDCLDDEDEANQERSALLSDVTAGKNSSKITSSIRRKK